MFFLLPTAISSIWGKRSLVAIPRKSSTVPPMESSMRDSAGVLLCALMSNPVRSHKTWTNQARKWDRNGNGKMKMIMETAMKMEMKMKMVMENENENENGDVKWKW